MVTHTLAGMVAMLAIYGVVISATRFTIASPVDGRKLGRRYKVILLVIAGLVLTYSMVGLVA